MFVEMISINVNFQLIQFSFNIFFNESMSLITKDGCDIY